MADQFSDWPEEETEELAALASKFDLTRREQFDPERHGNVEYAEEGSEIWSWTHLPEGWDKDHRKFHHSVKQNPPATVVNGLC